MMIRYNAPVICENGLVMSVQCDPLAHYCLRNGERYEENGVLTHVEIGFPIFCDDFYAEHSDEEYFVIEELDEYKELGAHVYCFVPVEELEKVIKKNEGIKQFRESFYGPKSEAEKAMLRMNYEIENKGPEGISKNNWVKMVLNKEKMLKEIGVI